MTDFVADLAALDPAREWAAWEPTASDQWDLPKAGHLLRRAAFAGNWPELQEAVAAGPDVAIDRLFAGGPGADEFDRVMDAVAPAAYGFRQPGQPTDPLGVDLEGWWVHRMVLSPHPLRERMTLFWHNHFATSIAKVKRPDLMRDQNQLFRSHALGKFGSLAQAVSKDPAMLVWLDSNSNVRGKPNENYARELMELFCLGVGNYSEADVREAARAFTGWHTNANVDPNMGYNPSLKPAFVFNRSQHDDGVKLVLGQSGQWDGGDVVRVVLGRPACPLYLARKLYRGFVGEAVTPPDALLQPLADRLRETDLDIGDALKLIFRSRHFYGRFAVRQRVKGPAEFTVGLLRAFEAKLPTEPVGQSLSAALQELGQTLFAPPSVKGWDGGPAWLNTATVLARHNLAWRLLQGASGPHAVRLNPSGPADAEGRVAYLLDLLLQPAAGEVDPRVRRKLAEFLAAGGPKGPAADRRVREAAHAIATLPLFQMA